MGAEEILSLLMAAEPAVKELVVDLLAAFKNKDSDSVRKATEAALRLAFEAREDARA